MIPSKGLQDMATGTKLTMAIDIDAMRKWAARDPEIRAHFEADPVGTLRKMVAGSLHKVVDALVDPESDEGIPDLTRCFQGTDFKKATQSNGIEIVAFWTIGNHEVACREYSDVERALMSLEGRKRVSVTMKEGKFPNLGRPDYLRIVRDDGEAC